MVQAPLIARSPSAVILALAMFHVAALVAGHVLGNKTSGIGPFIVTLTVLSFPVTFLTTDLLNEHGGRAVALRISALSVACVGFAFVMIELARVLPDAANSHLPKDSFDHVLAVSPAQTIVLLSGYGLGQVADIWLFHRLRVLTAGRHLWLRALGSTTVGEVVDGVVVSIFQFVLPPVVPTVAVGGLDTTWSQAGVRLGLAVALLPIVYGAHGLIGRSARR